MSDDDYANCYTVRVTHRDGVYRLQIPELLLIVRATDIEDGYLRLRKRQQEIVAFARSIGALDDLPRPEEPPAWGSLVR